ncbi:GH3 auxin-responsive promoter family protein [Clostridium massiliamazoniense]|uniref:GH3 auxin-responsive promoter family protein n=1 Tax=Clostridium massiliamazoniense TaxID=1347366 RepID=UPI0006D7D29F|nr:GH3 auxin-responsive promoter family protein [Clostridium massiliamazoniense]
MKFNKFAYKILIKKGHKLFNEFNDNTKNPLTVNFNTLIEILKDNKTTEYGHIHKFQDISTIEDFKMMVPLSDYTNFKDYIDRMANGEKNLLLSDPIEFFSHTSGTTGYQKLIPNTKKSRTNASKYMGLLTQFIVFDYLKYKWTYKKGLMLTDMLETNKSSGGITISSATSGGMRGIKFLIPYIWTSPLEVMKVKDRESSLYLHLLFALEYKDLMYIGGTFISSILDLFRILESNYDKLIYDIKTGTINKNLNISNELKKAIMKKLKPNPERSNYLQKEFKKGFKNIAKRIWPNLNVIITVTGGNFSIYDNKVKYYIASIPIYSSAYGASESSIAINPYLNKVSYVLLPDAAFFEFIKENDIFLKNPKTYNLNELEINQNYEIVVTSFNGLYRYRLGDVIKVIDFYNKSPELIFLYRKNQLLNMVSEKMTEEQVKNALSSLENKLSLKIIDYCTSPNNSTTPGNYLFFIELNKDFPHKKKLEEMLDLELCNSNKAYHRFREKNALSRVQIILLEKGSFEKFKEFLIKKGASKNQLKIPRVITSKELLNIFNYHSI